MEGLEEENKCLKGTVEDFFVAQTALVNNHRQEMADAENRMKLKRSTASHTQKLQQLRTATLQVEVNKPTSFSEEERRELDRCVKEGRDHLESFNTIKAAMSQVKSPVHRVPSE